MQLEGRVKVGVALRSFMQMARHITSAPGQHIFFSSLHVQFDVVSAGQ